MSRILVIDDEPNVLSAFQDLLGGAGHEVAVVRWAEAALELLETQTFDLVLTDIRLPGVDGLEVLRRLKERQPMLPVIVMTGQGTMGTAIEATKLGAFDYHVKPFDPAEILATVEKALRSARLARRQVALDPEAVSAFSGDAIIGRSPGMQEVYKAIGRVAATDATVLIRGESGTGKELVARALHQHSRRHQRPLSVVNCVAIPDTLLESELFGYERGAFTGAVARKIGKLEQADGGTLFLDEAGDVSLGIQAKILRVLQERNFERLGGNETIRVDVRVLAATNRNLEKAIAAGTFREDLYHRLNVVTIQVPPLRQRREDIPRLVDFFLERFARELGIGKPPVAPEAIRLLCDFAWPGNVRQLEHCLQRAIIFTQGHPIQAADLPLGADSGCGETAAPSATNDEFARLAERYLASYTGSRACEEFLERAERLLIAEAMRRSRGNQTHAARLLGIPRPTLHAKLQKHALRDRPEGSSGSPSSGR